jgi:flagellar motor switch protein FliN/FliY
MSDGSLSQDEIDALLQGTDTFEMDSVLNSDALSNQEITTFQNILNNITNSQSSNLAMLIGKNATIESPRLESRSFEQLASELNKNMIEVKIDFTDGQKGEHSYYLATDTALKIVSPMLGQEGIKMDDMALSTIGEAISNLTGPTATALGNQVNKTIQTSPPISRIIQKNDITLAPGGNYIKVTYSLKINGEPATQIVEVFASEFVKEIVSAGSGAGSQSATSANKNVPKGNMNNAMGPNMGNMFADQQPFANMGGQQNYGPAGGGYPGGMQNAPNVQPVQFANFHPGGGGSQEQGNIGLLMDVYMEMTVELGRTKKLIKDILTIGEGTIIELDKLAGEPVDILVNHKLIAKGEVVVIDENFGVRVTEIVSPMERMGDLT